MINGNRKGLRKSEKVWKSFIVSQSASQLVSQSVSQSVSQLVKGVKWTRKPRKKGIGGCAKIFHLLLSFVVY